MARQLADHPSEPERLKATELQIATEVTDAALDGPELARSDPGGAVAARAVAEAARSGAEQVRSRHGDQLRSRAGAARSRRRAQQRAARHLTYRKALVELRARADQPAPWQPVWRREHIGGINNVATTTGAGGTGAIGSTGGGGGGGRHAVASVDSKERYAQGHSSSPSLPCSRWRACSSTTAAAARSIRQAAGSGGRGRRRAAAAGPPADAGGVRGRQARRRRRADSRSSAT